MWSKKVFLAAVLAASADAFAPATPTLSSFNAQTRAQSCVMSAQGPEKTDMSRRAVLGLAPALASFVLSKPADALDLEKLRKSGAFADETGKAPAGTPKPAPPPPAAAPPP
eukprot:CAMPEP_0196739812 /NCGR_PEP_ID=MMETSP1091-20130531/26251_1 /TAXON_ID=302021 /ORGANISM="Rhodomonas sp., Strain CCMP768" /LENGTH=110 /DNA_ID=CAMNT_0042084589 /DNA_START=26 /DNA_END=354 /DNA_ORIENTATION=+